MRKAVAATVLAFFVMGSVSLRAQNVEDTTAPPILPDGDYSVPDGAPAAGQIHGYIPISWTASMITAIDLQTEEGQNWFQGLSAAQSVNEETKFVCENPGPSSTSAEGGDFYFYDMPPGSYVIAACMQTADGHWRSGASVIAINPGQDALVALGPAGGPIRRAGVPFLPDYYVGLWSPVWFGPHFAWNWHSAGWRTSVYFHTSPARIAPIWVRPAPVAVGARIFVPPYREVLRGNYTYSAFRKGTFVRTSVRGGVMVPTAHSFHPVTPEAEARLHADANVRSPEPRREPTPVFGNEVRSETRGATRGDEPRVNGVVADDTHGNGSRASEARPAAPPHAVSNSIAHEAATPAPQSRQDLHAAPAPAPRADSRPAPEPRVDSRPAAQPRPESRQESRPAPHQEARPKVHEESQRGTPSFARTGESRRTS